MSGRIAAAVEETAEWKSDASDAKLLEELDARSALGEGRGRASRSRG